MAKYKSKHTAGASSSAGMNTEAEKRKAVKPKPVGKKKGPIVLLAVLAVIALSVVLGGVAVTNSGKNLPKVFIGDIDVSGMSTEETLRKLEQSGWSDKTATHLVVTTIGNQQIDIDPVKSGMMLTMQDAADLASRYGHDGGIVVNLFTYLRNLVSAVDINQKYTEASSEYLDSCIENALSKIDDYMGEEQYTIDLEQSLIRIKKGFNDISIDREAFKNAVLSALENGEKELIFKEVTKEPECPDFAAILKEVEKEPRDASYTDDNKFDVIDEVVGCEFDVENAKKCWTDAGIGDEVDIPISVTWPSVTGEELRNRLYHDLLGAMTTEFPASSEDRVSNVNLCSSKIDGAILYPGDVFSYNDLVGPRTKEAGFLDAPAYSDGEVKTELGGGACQVASTTYAATLFAFLETVERTCHQFPVSYMQMGTDATVAWTEDGTKVDFKFRNNKNYPVKVVAICDTEGRKLTVEIWGTLEDTDYMPIEFDNRYYYMNTYDRIIEPAYPGREGYVIKLSIIGDTYSLPDNAGLQTLTHRLVYDSSGNLVEDNIVNLYVENIKGYGMDTYYKHPE